MGLVSVLLPDGAGWSVEQSPTKISFGRLGKVPSQSFAGMVVLARLPALSSPEEFFDWNVRQRTRDTGDPRYKDLVNEKAVTVENGVWVFRFHAKYEDAGANNLPAGVPSLVVEDIGAVFRHPTENGLGVYAALSRRSTPQDVDPAFERSAKEFLNSLEFRSSPVK